MHLEIGSFAEQIGQARRVSTDIASTHGQDQVALSDDALEDRLQFDVGLVDSRERFERQLNRMRTTVIRRFDLKPPPIWT